MGEVVFKPLKACMVAEQGLELVQGAELQAVADCWIGVVLDEGFHVKATAFQQGNVVLVSLHVEVKLKGVLSSERVGWGGGGG